MKVIGLHLICGLFLCLLPCFLQAQETEPAIACPYPIEEGDGVYFRLFRLELNNPRTGIEPYFELVEVKDEKLNDSQGTKVYPGNFSGTIANSKELVCDADVAEYVFYVKSAYGDIPLAYKRFKTENFVKQFTEENSSVTLNLSDKDTVTFQFSKQKKNRYYIRVTAFNLEGVKASADATTLPYNQKYTMQFSVTPKDTEKSIFKSDKFESKVLSEVAFPKKFEFLLRKSGSLSYLFQLTQPEGMLANAVWPSTKIFELLDKKMQEFPADPSKWIISLKDTEGNTIHLQFAGIRRIYAFKHVCFPVNSSVRLNYKRDTPPWLVMRVLCDGEKNYIEPPEGMLGNGNRDHATLNDFGGTNRWEGEVPEKYTCYFVVREGMQNVYEIQFREEKWFGSLGRADGYLIEESGFHALDFRDQIIIKKNKDAEDTDVEVQFKLIKEN